MLGKINTLMKQINFYYSLNIRPKRVKAYINWFHANLELITQPTIINAKPLKLFVEATNMCQLKCPFCPTGTNKHDRPPGKAKIDLVRKLLNEIGEYLFFIDFYNWGESLLNREIVFKWIKMAYDYKIISSLHTNLLFKMSEKDIDRLISSRLNHLTISIDGACKETYSIYRKNGNFELVIDNLNRIIKAKKKKGVKNPYVTWRFLVFGFNEHEINTAKKIAEDLDVNEIEFEAPYYDMSENPSNTENGVSIKWEPTNQQFQEKNRKDKANRMKPLKRCDWHYIASSINYDGTISPCCALYKIKDVFGDLGKNGEHSYMKEVNSRDYQKVRKYFANGRNYTINLACEKCHIPGIMDNGKGINKAILSFWPVYIVKLLQKLIS
jgi:MoaA/NifB/PqqE/SkfB family radical SAM enzyme